MSLGFQIGRFIGTFQTHQPGQRRGVTRLQTQGRISRIVPFFFAGLVVVKALQLEMPEDALHQ